MKEECFDIVMLEINDSQFSLQVLFLHFIP